LSFHYLGSSAPFKFFSERPPAFLLFDFLETGGSLPYNGDMKTLSLFFVLLCTTSVVAADKSTKWNLLFLVADDLRPELGCYGSAAKTPNLDALAKRGMRFDRAYCQQAVCNPSRSSFLTGRRPDSLHLWNNGTHFREKNPDVLTLPSWFQSQGYTTRCVGKIFHNWHTAEKGDRRSWSADEFLHYANHGDDLPQVRGALPENQTKLVTWPYGNTLTTECRDVPDDAYYDGRVAVEAVKQLGQLKDQPFFLAVGFWKPHAPFNAPKRYWDQYQRDKLPSLNSARPKNEVAWAFHDSREILGLPPKNQTPTAEQSAEMRHGYFANITYMDAMLGKVVDALQANQLAENTVIVFFSDHGYQIGEHSLWGKTSCFENDARVPLLIVPPAGFKSGSTDSLVELIDLFPTLSELCGLPIPKGLDGVSLVPILKDPTHRLKPVALSQHPRPAYFDRTPTKTPEAMGYSVRSATHRYTEWRAWTDGKLLGAELYNHRTDYAELNNVLAEPSEADTLKALKRELHERVPPDVAPSKR
jgi:iduronate 2-sulfatase